MYVNPKSDCPHVLDKKFISFEDFAMTDMKKPCEDCEELNENWICLTCGKFFCSRYKNSHFVKHQEANKDHSICISKIDLSFWCYDCITPGFEDSPGSYITSPLLKPYYKILSEIKFEQNETNTTIESLTEEMDQLSLDFNQISQIKYENFIEQLKRGMFKNIAFLTGAGISTAAGIPDFRSNNGLFKTLQDKFNLSTPEEFFSIQTFLKNPQYFYEFCKEFDLSKHNPTKTHVNNI